MKLIHLTAGGVCEEIMQRLKKRSLKEGRSDDKNEQIINKRMEVYKNETVPLLTYYPESLRLEINALQSPIEVARDILTGICASGNFCPPRP
jgi:adenylate kinase